MVNSTAYWPRVRIWTQYTEYLAVSLIKPVLVGGLLETVKAPEYCYPT